MIRKSIMWVIGLTLFAIVAGGVYYSWDGLVAPHEANDHSGSVWTCAMHPQVALPEPGQCPICGMQLIKRSSESQQATSAASVYLSERARKLAEVETVLVERRPVHLSVRMYGKLDFDESRMAHITARTPGRIERLFLDFTGISVKRGDHMVELYSPELVTAQQELLQAAQSLSSLRPDSSPLLARTLQENLESAREKLALWGLSDEQIADIESTAEAQEVLTINAPIGGVVVHKDAIEGRYVKEGTRIYTIADLSELWLVLDAYESDLPWLRHGQDIEFIAEAIPGKLFKGTIAFIDPVLDEGRRSVRIRGNVDNRDGLLKPGMFVRATVNPEVDAHGAVFSRDLEGKWIGVMHPQVVSDEAGVCPICGMDLVPAESLGYVSTEADASADPLVIPASAPLITGRRAIVYVENAELAGEYSARVVVLGPRAGDDYIVFEGLHAGERVVTNGNFKIDSAAQIMAKPSMMQPQGGGKATTGHKH